MSLLDAPLFLLYAPRVVHKLPGRLRVHLPVMRKIPSGYDVTVVKIARMLCEHAGFLEINPCLVTGNVVVRYDAVKHSQEDVLDYMRAVSKILILNRNHTGGATAIETTEKSDRLIAWLRERLDRGYFPGEELKVPDDILA